MSGGDASRSRRGDTAEAAPAQIVHVGPDIGREIISGDGGTEAGVTSPDALLRALLHMTHYHRRPAGEADVRAACALPPAGMDAETFRRAAAALGYRTRTETLSRATLARLPVPFVLLGRKDGAAWLCVGRAGPELTLLDPLSGRSERTAPESVLARAGTALLMKPEPGERRASWRDAVLAPVRGVAGEVILASVLINLFALAAPVFLMTVFNKVIGERALDTLQVLAIGMAALYGFDALLRGLRGYVVGHTAARLEAVLGGRAMRHLLRLPYRELETAGAGAAAERVRQIETLREFLSGQAPLLLVDLAFVALFVVAAMLISPVIGAIVLGAVPVIVLAAAAFHGPRRRLVEESLAARTARAAGLAEAVANALTVKALGLEPEVERRWGERLARAAHAGLMAARATNLATVAAVAVQHLTLLLVVYVGARLVIAGEMSLGGLVAVNLLAARTLGPLRHGVAAWSQWQAARATLADIGTLLETPAEAAPGMAAPAPILRGDLEVEDVHFRYAPERPPVLRGVGFRVETGTILGLIGPPGSGKSTLLKLVQGLYAPSAGRILIDGTDVAQVAPAALRRQMGAVPQEIQLFAGTVRDNIAVGLPFASPERVVAVAKFVGAHDFIQRLPDGYETALGEGGSGLSAGQRQLVAVARALIRNPRILILDETTSALDPLSEAALLRNLRRAARGRTILVASHRAAPIALADRVILLVDGEVARIGAAQEMLAFARRQPAE